MTSLQGSELSERELDILRLVATGASNKEIAQKLFISPNTVKVHLRNIFAKIGALSRTEVALYAVRQGLVKTVSPLPSSAPAVSLPVSIQESLEPDLALPSASKSRLWVGFSVVFLLLALLIVGGVLFVSWLKPFPTQVPATLELVAKLPTPATSTPQPRWKTLPFMQAARRGLAAAAISGQIYAFGGEADQGVTGMVEAYDPVAKIWSPRKSMPQPATDIQAAVLGGKVYIPGGKLKDGKISSSLFIYDPLQDEWQRGPDLPYPVCAYSLAVFEGRLYLFGGWDGIQILNTVLEYDPSLETWNPRSPLPTGRAYSAAAEAGGMIYVLGGFDGEQALSVSEAYTPSLEGSAASPWSSAPGLPEGRFGMAAASVADTILIVGGNGPGDSPAPSYHFFPSINSWVEEEKPDTQPLTGLAAVPLEQFVYILGGKLGEQSTSQVKSYQAVYTISIPIIP